MQLYTYLTPILTIWMFRSVLTPRLSIPTIRHYAQIATMSLKVGHVVTHWTHRRLTFGQAISAKDAASLDKDLMDMGGWSLDQLMELAGLSVSQAGELLDRHA